MLFAKIIDLIVFTIKNTAGVIHWKHSETMCNVGETV